ncbi:MAG: BON domain-containing protein [Vulcanimicrobiaceae bacterium]
MSKMANEELRDDVLAELDADPQVDTSRVGVVVDNGAVTLTGTVPSYTQKWATEEAVKRVKGVIAVAEQIEVELPAMHQRNDVDIARTIAGQFYWDTALPSSVQATVQNGYVTLTGEVDWNYQREEAERVARRIKGVRGITNAIALAATTVAPQNVRGEIQRMFHRDVQLDANNIHIAIDDGKVTLTGSVHSWFERSEASRAAWSVRGVRAVDNRISIL